MRTNPETRIKPIWISSPNAYENYDPTPLHKAAGLTAKQSEAIRLYHEGHTEEQIALALGITQSAAHQRITGAEARLRQYGQTLYPED